MKTVELTEEQFRILKKYIGDMCHDRYDCEGCQLGTGEERFCPMDAIEKAGES